MIYYNDHFFERFDVLFGKKSSIVAGEEYPLGYFAAEAVHRSSYKLMISFLEFLF